ncbi:MAG: zinc ribbon domain-containing protein [Methanobrevibacter sp.]|uniref:zinc ribbon domain-containing protein n=1 Tax=Methanobrevibacter sp. TaxID=66852 RepID=UPI0026DFB0DB|nr:zinc ribbon domain-containing protein [Methanobrevibacter sp.]MDO5849100.1 zinc ribbon domain-containing protein [Methanobrevibacter sp.]
MKCSKCGHTITKANSKFCPNCGNNIDNTNQKPVEVESNSSNNNQMIIAVTVVIIAIIIALTAAYSVGVFGPSSENSYSSDKPDVQVQEEAKEIQTSDGGGVGSQDNEKGEQSGGSWQPIGSFSGSGSGSKTISVPAGQIRIDLSAYPIKNYATNHLYVSGSNGKSAGVDWGSRSAVATRSDSLSFTSSSSTTFTIDYYETVSWNVEVYKYQ